MGVITHDILVETRPAGNVRRKVLQAAAVPTVDVRVTQPAGADTRVTQPAGADTRITQTDN